MDRRAALEPSSPLGGTKTVLFVARDLATGGVERFIASATMLVDRQRFTPKLALYQPKVIYPYAPDVAPIILGRRVLATLPRVIWRLSRLIDDLRPTVVVSGDASIGVVVREALRLSRHRPVFLSGIPNMPELNEHGLFGMWIRSMLPHVDLFTAVSSTLAAYYGQTHPKTSPRIRVVSNPVDFDRLDKMSRAPLPEFESRPHTLIAVGRLSPEKRYDLVIDAFAAIRQAFDAQLIVCGAGPSQSDIESRIRQHGLQRDVKLLGLCENPFRWLARADLLLQASDMEGLPGSLIEAQGLGIPVVSTDCRFGPADIVENGRTGLLTPTGNAAAMADAACTLLGDDGRRGEMATTARIRTRSRFTMEASRRELMAVLDEAALQSP